MRLVAWNANLNNQKRTLEQDVEILRTLQPDLIVLSETARPSDDNPSDACWFGDAGPGLAVVPSEGVSVSPHPANDGAPPFIACFALRGKIDCQLCAVWPVKGKNTTYHKILMAGLKRFSDVLTSERAIMVGDFNSSSRVVAQRKTHPLFVQAAGKLGLASVYHAQQGEAHGEETVGTYRHSDGREFHLDFCFTSNSIANSARLQILRDSEWSTRSDHFPLVVDFDI